MNLRKWRGARAVAEPRVYKTAPGYYGVGIGVEPPGHVVIQLGRYVFTTEPK